MKMRKLSFTIAAILFITGPGLGQDRAADPDLSDYMQRLGLVSDLPTVASVATAKAAADMALNAGCEAAIPALQAYAQQANHLSNLLTQSLAPYSNAVGDAQSRIRATMGNELAPASRQANELRTGRDQAWVQIAECYIETNRPLEATAQLSIALDRLDGTNAQLYRRARDLMWQLVGFNSDF